MVQTITETPSIKHRGTGRRKTSVAQVVLLPGSGKVQVNGQDISVYFSLLQHRKTALKPLVETKVQDKWDVNVDVQGGGKTGQAEAVVLGIGRALKRADPSFDHALRDKGFLTRDSRMKERKKYGFRGARRRPQWTKR